MKKMVSTFCFLGVLALTLFGVPQSIQAAALTEAQQATLTAALTERKPYADIISQAMAAGMGAEEVVQFLCNNCNSAPACVSDVVYAAITGGMDAEQAMSGALLAGADLQTVVNAGKSAGASGEAISAAALKNGFTAIQISNAVSGILGTGATRTTGGGRIGGGSGFGGSIGGPTGGGSTGGGTDGGIGGGSASGGAGGSVPATPSKP